MNAKDTIPVPPYTQNQADRGYASPHETPVPPNGPSRSGATPPPSQPSSPAASMPSARFSKRQWGVFACAVAEAVIGALVFYPSDLFGGVLVPGIGFSLFSLAALVFACALVGKQGRFDRVTVPLIIATALLALIPALFGNLTLRMFDYPLTLAAFTLTTFMTSRALDGCRVGIRAALEAIAFFFTSMFTNWLMPWRAMSSRNRTARTGARQSRGVLAGIGIAALAFIIIVPLLSSADDVFYSFFESIAKWFENLEIADIVWHLIWTLVTAPFLFGLLWGAVHAKEGGRAAGDEGVDIASRKLGCALKPATVIIVLAVVDAIYLLFAIVQFVYLFGGAEAAAMNGGYAEYARNGFFQLVVVAVINLCIGLAAAQNGHAAAGDSKRSSCMAVRVLTCLLIAFTVVILVSACLRMSLYIDAYGLTVSRGLTLLGMAFAAVLLVGLAIKTFYAKLNYFGFFVAAGIALWLVFNYSGIDARINDYNVDRFIADNEKHVDLAMIDYEMGVESVPALERLAVYLDEHPSLTLEDVDPNYYYDSRRFDEPVDTAEGSIGLIDSVDVFDDKYVDEEQPVASEAVRDIALYKANMIKDAGWQFWSAACLQVK